MYPLRPVFSHVRIYKYAQSMPASIAPPGPRRGGLPVELFY
jgi:hypothetical protein